MSMPIQPPTAAAEFQAHFGAAPGSPDLAADCKKWEHLCAELIAEREKLRAELTVTAGQLELYHAAAFREWAKDYKPDFTKEEALAQFDTRPTVQEIIAELEKPRQGK